MNEIIKSKYGQSYCKIFPNTYRIIENVACSQFLIVGSERCLLIDAGCGSGNMRALIEELCEGKPYTVVNTHGHDDHAAADYQFDEIYIGKEDEWLVHHLYETAEGKENFRKELIAFAPKDNPGLRHFYSEEFRDKFDNAKVDFSIKYLEDGMEFDLGDTVITAHHIIGHTAGGYCFLDKDNRVLYSGDAILRHISVLHLGGGTIKDLKDGLKKALSLREYYDYFIGAHGHRQHGWRPLEPEYIEKIIELADEIDINKSEVKHECDGDGYEYYKEGTSYEDYEAVSIAYREECLKER